MYSVYVYLTSVHSLIHNIHFGMCLVHRPSPPGHILVFDLNQYTPYSDI